MLHSRFLRTHKIGVPIGALYLVISVLIIGNAVSACDDDFRPIFSDCKTALWFTPVAFPLVRLTSIYFGFINGIYSSGISSVNINYVPSLPPASFFLSLLGFFYFY